ncbi:MAG: biotin/lipoyl-containing protein [Anaerolineae bacterium]
MKQQFSYHINGEIKTVTIEPDGSSFRVTIGDKVYPVTAQASQPGELVFAVEGQPVRAQVARDGDSIYVAVGGDTWTLAPVLPQSQRRTAGHHPDSGNLEASMPGQVLEVLVAPGDTVARGDTLVVLEAMKMELRLSAPYAGHVRQVHCTVGQVVERGQVLVEIEPSQH